MAEEIGIVYVETSAISFEETKIAFNELVTKILQRKKHIHHEEGYRLKLKKMPSKKGEDSCC